MSNDLWRPVALVNPSPESDGGPIVSRLRTRRTIGVFTSAQVIMGLVDPKGQRLSDFVNDRTSSYLVLYEAEVQDLLMGEEARPPVPELTVRKEVTELIVPQDTASGLRPQVATRQLAIELTTSFFRVRGDLHRRDTDPSNLAQLMSGFNRNFLPLTGATVEHLWRRDVQVSAAIVLVNAQHLAAWAPVTA